MIAKIESLLHGDTVEKWLLWAAVILFFGRIAVFMPQFVQMLQGHVMQALYALVITLAAAVQEPLMMLGMARLIAAFRTKGANNE